MKFYDKHGDLHYTMLGAFSANLFGKSKISTKPKSADEAEDKPIEVMYQSEEISDTEVNSIVKSMMDKLDEPLDSFVKGELNSHIGEVKLINVISGVLAAEIRDKPRVFEYNAEKIIPAFGETLHSAIITKKKIYSEGVQNG